MSTYNFLRHLMRLLTPEEIQELTTISCGENKQPLTDIVMKRVMTEDQEDLYLKVELGNENIAPSMAPVEATPENGQEETKKGVVFILDLKKKLEKGQRALKEKEIYGLYQKAAGLDVDFSKANKDDLKKSSNLGVLINKKQY